MARKKTRKQKIETAQKKTSQGVVYSLGETKISKSRKKKSKIEKPVQPGLNSLFDYDPKLLGKDIKKTVLLSMFLFGLELVAYFWLRTT